MRGRIEVGWPRIDGRRVTVPLTASGSAARRIICEDFWCEYDFDPNEVPQQILTVPVVANLLAIAWLEDLELSVATLDRTFDETVPAMREAWGGMFSALELGGSLEVAEIVSTVVDVAEGRAIALFSGGLDSMATAILRSEADTILCTYWGIDVPPDDAPSWDATWSRTERYAGLVGASTSFVRTNLRHYVDSRGLARRYGAELSTWEDGTSGITLLGMAAPVAVHRRASEVHIPATHTADMTAPYGTHPDIDETVRFGSVRCVHSGYDIDRIQKARLVAERTPGERWLVCLAGTAREGRNCGACPKCYRTGVNAIVAGVDPATVGLDMDWSSLPAFQREVEAGRAEARLARGYHWWVIQQHLPIPSEGLAPELRAFLTWLRAVDIYGIAPASIGPLRRLRGFLTRLIPHRLLPAARRLYVRVFPRW